VQCPFSEVQTTTEQCCGCWDSIVRYETLHKQSSKIGTIIATGQLLKFANNCLGVMLSLAIKCFVSCLYHQSLHQFC